MPDALVVRHVRDRTAGRCLRQSPSRLAGSVDVEPYDPGEVGAGRPHQLVPILARTAERPLVGKNPRAGAERLQLDPCVEAALDHAYQRAGGRVGLLVHVERRARVLRERPVRAPAREGAGRGAVLVVWVGRAGQVDGQVDRDDVAWIARSEGRPLGGRDHVVRRRHDAPEVRHRVAVVAQGAERANLGHATSWKPGWNRAAHRPDDASRPRLGVVESVLPPGRPATC